MKSGRGMSCCACERGAVQRRCSHSTQLLHCQEVRGMGGKEARVASQAWRQRVGQSGSSQTQWLPAKHGARPPSWGTNHMNQLPCATRNDLEWLDNTYHETYGIHTVVYNTIYRFGIHVVPNIDIMGIYKLHGMNS